MGDEKKKESYVNSIEDASIMRKFTVLFLLMSVIPVVLLYYFYTQFKNHGAIQITELNFNITLTLVIIGVMIGYVAMRAVLKKIIELTVTNKERVMDLLTDEQKKSIDEEKNEITALAMSFSEITNRLEENVRNLELTKKTLHNVMAKVGYGIANMQNIDAFLELIVETVTQALYGEIGILMLLDKKKNDLWVKTVYGKSSIELGSIRLKLSEESIFFSVVNSMQPHIIPGVTEELRKVQSESNIFKAPMVCVPMICKEKVRGVLIVCGRTREGDYGHDESNMLMTIASQTAAALDNARLNKDIESTYIQTVSALALAVDAKDSYSRGHLDRVAGYAFRLGKQMGLDDEDLNTLRDAAKLHDLGKIGIPDDVLRKEGPLTESEWELMKRHPEIGESIVRPIHSLGGLCDIIRHHHEKLDGTGYPDGLKGDEISPLVRILSIADIYDALTTDRSYRTKNSREKALEIMRDMKRYIDQDVLAVFEEALDS